MKNVFLWSYNGYSRSAKELATALGIRRIKHNGSRYVSKKNHLIINWGSVFYPPGSKEEQIINPHSKILDVRNKLLFFQKVSDKARCVPWTTDIQQAEVWNKKSTVVCRMSLTGQGGSGILLVRPEGQVPEAPLYTRYISKDMEFRVHIIDGEVIDTVRKIRNPDQEPRNWKIRSHDNGFIFVRNGFETPQDVQVQAKAAFVASELDFGAVDVLWNNSKQKAYVLEINTAPGITNTSVTNYTEALRRLVEKRRGLQT